MVATSRFPMFHGAPIHMGDPQVIGVDLRKPYGGHGLTQLRGDEVPIFWACGATAQVALEQARLPIAIAPLACSHGGNGPDVTPTPAWN